MGFCHGFEFTIKDIEAAEYLEFGEALGEVVGEAAGWLAGGGFGGVEEGTEIEEVGAIVLIEAPEATGGSAGVMVIGSGRHGRVWPWLRLRGG